MILDALPDDVLYTIAQHSKNITNLSFINKTPSFRHLPYNHHKINYTFNMKDLHNLVDHSEHVYVLEVDAIDIFFDIQLTIPNLQKLVVSNCTIKKELLEMYSNVCIEYYNCKII